MYADKITDSMKIAIDETARRRKIQEEYNRIHNIVPTTIVKKITDTISNTDDSPKESKIKKEATPSIEVLEKEMKEAAKNLDFERAMELRDIIFELKSGFTN